MAEVVELECKARPRTLRAVQGDGGWPPAQGVLAGGRRRRPRLFSLSAEGGKSIVKPLGRQ